MKNTKKPTYYYNSVYIAAAVLRFFATVRRSVGRSFVRLLVNVDVTNSCDAAWNNNCAWLAIQPTIYPSIHLLKRCSWCLLAPRVVCVCCVFSRKVRKVAVQTDGRTYITKILGVRSLRVFMLFLYFSFFVFF